MEASDTERWTSGQRCDLSSQRIPGTPGQVRLPEQGGDKRDFWIKPFSIFQTICFPREANGVSDGNRPHHYRLGLDRHADAQLPGALLQPLLHPTSRT